MPNLRDQKGTIMYLWCSCKKYNHILLSLMFKFQGFLLSGLWIILCSMSANWPEKTTGANHLFLGCNFATLMIQTPWKQQQPTVLRQLFDLCPRVCWSFHLSVCEKANTAATLLSHVNIAHRKIVEMFDGWSRDIRSRFDSLCAQEEGLMH